MRNLLALAEGKKTYTAALALGLLAAANYLGYIDPEMYTALFTLLVGGGLAALRASI